MAELQCSACEDLRQTSPSFVVKGLTEDNCTSLANNTGLNPKNKNDSCEDLNDINDCLVGMMENEVNAYDVCDWKKFMKAFIPNVWTTLKAIICTLCGVWKHLADILKRLDDMCELLDALISPPLGRYGTLLNDYGENNPTHRGGVIGVKNNKPVVVPMAKSELDPTVWAAQSVGIYLGKQKIARCSDGVCRSYEWIAPNMAGYRVHPEMDLNAGDILWYATKSQCMDWGMSEAMWESFVISSWTWKDYGLVGTPGVLGWFRLSVDNNRLELTYQGQVGATANNANRQITESDNPARRYIYSC